MVQTTKIFKKYKKKNVFFLKKYMKRICGRYECSTVGLREKNAKCIKISSVIIVVSYYHMGPISRVLIHGVIRMCNFFRCVKTFVKYYTPGNEKCRLTRGNVTRLELLLKLCINELRLLATSLPNSH